MGNALETVDKPAVWTVSHLFHDVFECDQISDIYGRLVLERVGICSGIHVHEMPRAF